MNEYIEKYLDYADEDGKLIDCLFYIAMAFVLVVLFPLFVMGWVKSKFSK